MLIANEIDNALRLRTLETLLTALDSCSDVVQIADHEDNLIFQNGASEKALGFSSSDYQNGGRHLWDLQSTSAMYSHAVLEENDTTVMTIKVISHSVSDTHYRLEMLSHLNMEL